MGIEYIIANHDKKEFLDFDKLGFGTKIGSTTSEPIASFLTWLLINPEGYGEDAPRMLGRWAGDRVEIIGDYGTEPDRQQKVRKEFADITVGTISAFAEGMPFERITKLQPMGLIDKDGRVVVDPENRASVAKYWEDVEAEQGKALDLYLKEVETLFEILRTGTAEQVRSLPCPITGGPLRVQYLETKTGPSRVVVSGTRSDFVERVPGLSRRPIWVNLLGEDFITEPKGAEK